MATEENVNTCDGRNMGVSPSTLQSELDSFKQTMDEMEEILNEVKTATSGAEAIWQGESSDITLGSVHSFQETFTEIEEGNKERITFLKNVISRYVITKEERIQYLDRNEGSFDVSL